MRTTALISLLPILLLSFLANGQQSGIDAALQKGSAADLGTYFNKTVELSLPEIEDSFPADQAITVLSDFFAKQTVQGYKRVHVSAPQAGRAAYSIGDLSTANGMYRISLYYDAQQKVTEIRIQK